MKTVELELVLRKEVLLSEKITLFLCVVISRLIAFPPSRVIVEDNNERRNQSLIVALIGEDNEVPSMREENSSSSSSQVYNVIRAVEILVSNFEQSNSQLFESRTAKHILSQSTLQIITKISEPEEIKDQANVPPLELPYAQHHHLPVWLREVEQIKSQDRKGQVDDDSPFTFRPETHQEEKVENAKQRAFDAIANFAAHHILQPKTEETVVNAKKETNIDSTLFNEDLRGLERKLLSDGDTDKAKPIDILPIDDISKDRKEVRSSIRNSRSSGSRIKTSDKVQNKKDDKSLVDRKSLRLSSSRLSPQKAPIHEKTFQSASRAYKSKNENASLSRLSPYASRLDSKRAPERNTRRVDSSNSSSDYSSNLSSKSFVDSEEDEDDKRRASVSSRPIAKQIDDQLISSENEKGWFDEWFGDDSDSVTTSKNEVDDHPIQANISNHSKKRQPSRKSSGNSSSGWW